MMVDDTRIAQFKQMAEADPDNELGHFSLGKAYLEAGQAESALAPFRRAIELNSRLSKGYQLLGDALAQAGQKDEAVRALTDGIGVASEQGDRIPLEAMASRLREWGSPVPEVANSEPAKAAQGAPASDATGAACARCRRPGDRLAKRPFKGELGEKIHAHTCQACWAEWVGMGTKVINELGLSLGSAEGQAAYDQYLIEFLQLEEV